MSSHEERFAAYLNDPVAHLRRLANEAAALQESGADNAGKRFKDLRDSLVLAALYELPRLLDEFERLTK